MTRRGVCGWRRRYVLVLSEIFKHDGNIRGKQQRNAAVYPELQSETRGRGLQKPNDKHYYTGNTGKLSHRLI